MNDVSFLAQLIELAKTQGVVATVVVIGALTVLLNVDKIGAGFERLLCRFVPSYETRAQHREAERQRIIATEQHAREAQEKERVDTILVWKDLLLEYRKRLDDNERAINLARQDLLDVVRLYEKRDAQVVEVLRDFSDVMRSLKERIDKLTYQVAQLQKEKASV